MNYEKHKIVVLFYEPDLYKEDSKNARGINVKCNFKLKDTISDWGISVSSTFLVNVKFYFPFTFIYLVESTSV